MNRKTPVSPSSAGAAIAACARPLSAGDDVQLLPAGKFRATDGRPKDVPHWFVDTAAAAAIIAGIGAFANDLVVDYEHQTLLVAKNGQPAPAAGWFKALEWREGDGLYALNVQWTPRAAEMIKAGEYRYISPVFSYHPKTGAILNILNAALTNNPALDGMDEVAVRAAASLLFKPQSQETDMQLNELLVALRKALGLPETADVEAVLAAATKVSETLGAKDTEIAALTKKAADGAAPDPAKFVPIETVKAMQDGLAALRAEINGGAVDGLVTAALSDGRLLPAQEKWARELGGKDVTTLKVFLDTVKPIAALTTTQTQGKDPGGKSDEQLSEPQLAICKAMGVSPEDFKKTLAAQAAV